MTEQTLNRPIAQYYIWDYLDVIVADVMCISLLKGDNFLEGK